MSRPKFASPEEHAKHLFDSHLMANHPDVYVMIILELARAKYHDDYIEKVAREYRKLTNA